MILLIDNYDSFAYNLFQYLGELGAEVVVHRNDALSVEDAIAMSPQAVVISPGPGRPADAGISKALIAACGERRLPLLGVCLGHQALGEVFGAKVCAAKKLMHGKTSQVTHDSQTVFAGLPSPLTVMRYHSLTLADDSVPPVFVRTAENLEDGEVMAIRHQELPLEGVQFHPESIMTQDGKTLLANFMNYYLGEKK